MNRALQVLLGIDDAASTDVFAWLVRPFQAGAARPRLVPTLAEPRYSGKPLRQLLEDLPRGWLDSRLLCHEPKR